MYRSFFKRLIDIVLSFLGISVLALPMLVISIFIYIDDPGPILFKQKRIKCKDNDELIYFNLMKFRTMKTSTPHDVPTHLLKDADSYITNVGRFLRKTSLDELPQLFQIFVGNMSIIGPRPALWNQEDLILERDKYGANDILCGLTGWAQINGRDELSVEDKAQLDGYYKKHLSFLFDLKCFILTICKVIRRDNIVEGC